MFELISELWKSTPTKNKIVIAVFLVLVLVVAIKQAL